MEFSSLVGQTLLSVVNDNNAQIVFTTVAGCDYRLSHHDDCCESVYVEDVNGDLEDLVGEPILFAEESASNEHPEGVKPDYCDDSFTWTFYRIGTIKGTVVIRWFGTSNGYYS